MVKSGGFGLMATAGCSDVVDEKASVELSMPSVVSLTAELLELDENSIFEDFLGIYHCIVISIA